MFLHLQTLLLHNAIPCFLMCFLWGNARGIEKRHIFEVNFEYKLWRQTAFLWGAKAPVVAVKNIKASFIFGFAESVFARCKIK